MRNVISLMLCCCPSLLFGQSTFRAYIKDRKTGETIPGAIVSFSKIPTLGGAADPGGLVIINNAPDGGQQIRCHAIGYLPVTDSFRLPLAATDTPVIMLESEDREMEEVTISTTRSGRTIKDIPTRIELIEGEEVEEKANMKPGDIKMVVSESTGIQTLQTSATSGNSSIRIQGMDGRYTQVLKDGYPLFAGFSGGLGLMQTPPLDLKQVEIVKGASSTLYGGGSIAGLINLISKTPGPERELKFIFNGTTAGGFDVNSFYSKRNGKTGITLYSAIDYNKAYAPAQTLFTAIPEYKRYTLNPKFFWYPNETTTIIIGINGMYENRVGGDIMYLRGQKDSMHTYYEDNKSERISSVIEVKKKLPSGTITFKNSIDHFNRIITKPDNAFDGTQSASFSEANYVFKKNKKEWIFGANVFTDIFKEKALTLVPSRNYRLTTFGVFAQNTWDISSNLVLETGLRYDYVTHYGGALLPRVSFLYKHGTGLSIRLGGGMGYKAPTLFTEESERISYRNLLPVKPDSNTLEHSYGVNLDLNYKTTLADGKVSLSMNQLFFFTQIESPLILSPLVNDYFRFVNSPAHIDAEGMESNVKIGYRSFKLFLGYTFTFAYRHYSDIFAETPLTPRHHTNSVLIYEVEDKWKIGLEAYYYSPQKLSDGLTGRDYWLCGFMAEKIWKHYSIFINLENILDSRQTRFDSIYTGKTNNPYFRDIYAPLDGFIMNGGFKLRL